MPNAPNWPTGYIPTAAEWNAQFAGKLDQTGNSQAAPMGGPLFLNGDPNPGTTQAATANYVDLVSIALGTEAVLRVQGDEQNWNNVGRNYLTNSLVQVATRGTGAVTSQGYTADGWFVGTGAGGGSISVTPTKVTIGALGAEVAQYVLQVVFTGGSAAGDCFYIGRPIENLLRCSGQTFYWQEIIKSTSGTSKIGFEIIQYPGTGSNSPSARVTGIGKQAIQLSNSWALYNFSVAVPSASGLTLGNNNDSFTEVRYWLSSGSTNNTRASGIGVQSDTVAFWGDQFEPTNADTPIMTALELKSPAQTQMECSRWLRKLTATQVAGYSNNTTITTASKLVCFSPMWQTPSTASISWGASVNVASQTVTNISADQAELQITATAAGPMGQTFNGGYLTCEPPITT